MSKFTKFMKENKTVKENVKFQATASLTDDKGEPLFWEFKPITTSQNDLISEECTVDTPIKGKIGAYRPKLNANKYLAKMICATTIFPNLNDKDLQDSYGVMTAEELLKALVDDPGEYTNLATFIQGVNGFTPMEERVDELKN